MHRLSVLAAAPVAALLLSGIVLAQDEESESQLGSRSINPEECDIEPLAAEDVGAVLGSGDEIDPVTFQVPLGEGVGTEDEDRIIETVRSVIACLNAGDYLRGAAHSTDNGARVLFGGLAANGPQALQERLAEAPVARTEEGYIRLISVTDATVMPDGKLAAFVVINEPTRPPRGQETLLFIFADEDGQLLFDNLVGFSTVSAEDLATPTADATPSA